MTDTVFSATKQAEAVAQPTKKASRARPRFFMTMATAAALIVFVGFARTYYLSAWTGAPRIPLLVHIHAAFFSAWIVLLLVQTTLIAKHRTGLHKKVGVLGAALAIVMIVLGYATSIEAARRGFMGQFPNQPNGFADPLAFLALGLGDIFTFAVLVTAALYARSRPETHKRLMLLATISLLPAAMTRFPLGPARLPVALFTLLGFLMAGPIYDWKTHGRVNAVFIWGGLLILISEAVRPALGNSAAWHTFAFWLVR